MDYKKRNVLYSMTLSTRREILNNLDALKQAVKDSTKPGLPLSDKTVICCIMAETLLAAASRIVLDASEVILEMGKAKND